MMKTLLSATVDIAKRLPHDQGCTGINGPAVFGVSPEKPCLFTFPVRGEAPLKFSYEGNLPPGICLDAVTGRLFGKTSATGTFPIKIIVENQHGSTEKNFQLCIMQNNIALTPLLGWTSWNAFTQNVDHKKVYANAKYLVDLGLAARGFSYVNIDSCWQGNRDPKTCALQPNSRFPDMGKLVDDIHSLGLKAGIYSTPMVIAWGTKPPEIFLGSTSYPLNPAVFHEAFGGCGKTHYEQQDAEQWAKWGFDYLKYDWPACDIEHCRLMSEALRKTDRDFVFSLTTNCQYSLLRQYQQYANMYRSNTDTRDLWENISQNAFNANSWSKHMGPGHWFDMDMMALGTMNINGAIPNRLTRDEMITHMSMWAFFPSPIQISCDLAQIDDFTLNLLSNEEILAINQDYLGLGAEEIHHETIFTDGRQIREYRIYRRLLSEGRIAYAFFNVGNSEQQVEFNFGQETLLHDPWALRDLGSVKQVMMNLPSHGCRILIAKQH